MTRHIVLSHFFLGFGTPVILLRACSRRSPL
jgi:hypothetical protein